MIWGHSSHSLVGMGIMLEKHFQDRVCILSAVMNHEESLTMVFYYSSRYDGSFLVKTIGMTELPY